MSTKHQSGLNIPPPDVSATLAPPAFRPREYPGLQALRLIFNLVAAICLVTFVVGETLVIRNWLSINSASADSVAPDDRLQAAFTEVHKQAAMAALLAPQLPLCLGVALPGILCLALAHLIRLLIDVQGNTQEAAYYLRQAKLG